MIVVTICYREGINTDYYFAHHVPRSQVLMKPLGLLRAETRSLLAGQDGSKPPYEVVTSLYFADMESFQSCMAHPDLAELLADAPNFYTGIPEIYVGAVLIEANYQ
ncbi:MAG: EthD family reductase [Bacillota bacterium]